MKIPSKGGIHNRNNTAGFVNIENWEGTEMKIKLEYLKIALKVIETLNGLELDVSNIHIGISLPSKERPAGLFYVFLDANKTVAYAIAGKTEE